MHLRLTFIAALVCATTYCVVWPATSTAETESESTHQVASFDAVQFLAGYQSALDVLMSKIPDKVQDNSDPLFLPSVMKSSVYPVVGWGEIQADTKMISISKGARQGCWILVIEPGHPWLEKPGPTFNTAIVSNVVTITIRPHEISQTFKPIILVHEMLHAYNRLYRSPETQPSEELMAYIVERESFNVMTQGKFSLVLDATLKKFEIVNQDVLVEMKENSNGKHLGEVVEYMERELKIEVPLSRQEREIRDGFYIVSLADRVGESAGLSIEARIRNTNELLAKISMY